MGDKNWEWVETLWAHVICMPRSLWRQEGGGIGSPRDWGGVGLSGCCGCCGCGERGVPEGRGVEEGPSTNPFLTHIIHHSALLPLRSVPADQAMQKLFELGLLTILTESRKKPAKPAKPSGGVLFFGLSIVDVALSFFSWCPPATIPRAVSSPTEELAPWSAFLNKAHLNHFRFSFLQQNNNEIPKFQIL